MLQAHSPLWHYLWVAPNVLLLILAVLMWRRGVYRQFPVFLVFTVVIPVEQLIVYAADVLPSVSGDAFWRTLWAGLLLEALLKFTLIGEIFGSVFGHYPSLARLGTFLIRGVGVVLVLLATLAAAYTKKDSVYWIISGAHILEQTIYMIECGLILFLFVFAAYFKLSWGRIPFGIALGLGISASVHLAAWALAANANFSVHGRNLIDMTNMATYHACVLIWFYYLLIPQKTVITSRVSVPAHSLEVWNQQLERLLHQ